MKTYKVTIDNDGTTSWYNEQNIRHNESGPALIKPNGYNAYFINGKLHNESGPAIIYTNGDAAYFINNIELTKEQWLAKTTTKELTLSEVIEKLGYNIKIIK